MNDTKLSEQIKQLIQQLNEDQLHELHNLISDRLNLFHRANALLAMKDFQVLDRVYFDYHGERKEGTVMRLNQRTISVTLDTGEKWKVAPDFLIKIIKADPTGQELSKAPVGGKLSRNDPCWCGSGKKYKKCHMK